MRYKGRCFRGHDPGWSFAPLSGEGARRTGGRFNRVGRAALYLATEYDTAIAECTHGFARRMPPLTLCDYDVDVDPVADLTTERGRSELGVSLDDLACPWLALAEAGAPIPSRDIAERIGKDGFAGMQVPAFFPGAQPRHINLVLWRWGDQLPTRVRVHDPDRRLPRNRKSWTDLPPRA